MKVAVITPYYKESTEILRQCHESVIGQTYPVTHVIVADGFPKSEIDSWTADHVVLPRAHGDIGSTPRLIGSYHAIGLGFDAVTFLDADNWFRHDHVEKLVQSCREAGIGFASSSRMLCRLDGTEMGPCPLIHPETFIDTNCMMFTRSGFAVLAQWVLMPSYGHLIGDRIMLYHVHQYGLKHVHNGEHSVYYRCGKEGLYRRMNEEIPEGVQPRPDYEASFAQWVAEGNPPLN